jgi:hypothetical protein
LASVTIATEDAPLPAWQVANFANPIAIKAKATHIAAYYCPIGQGAWDAFGLTNGMKDGPLTAPADSAVGGNGVYHCNNPLPTQDWGASNDDVDVLFAPTGAPNPSIPAEAALSSVMAAINASWSDDSPFTGILSFGQPYSDENEVFSISGDNVITNPSAPGLSA